MTTVRVIGRNSFRELGDNLKTSVESLSYCSVNDKTSNIVNIVSGDDFCVFLDEDENGQNQKIWMSGYDGSGQYENNPTSYNGFHEITFFNNINEKIKKICTHVSSLSIFWLTE